MLDSLSSAVSGLDAFQQEMDIIGNNIANINTTGFKTGRSELANSFSDTLQAATSTTAPEQVGTGVTTSAITNNWSTGTINSTGDSNDLAINGNGFFVVQDPTTNAQYVTQAGDFSVDNNGYLITDSGMRVLGTNAAGTAGPIQLTSTAGSVSSWAVSSQGAITLNLSNGTSVSGGQILLQNFADPQQLTSYGDNLYTNIANAGPLAAAVAPGNSGTGTIQQGALELSNVDLSSQMADLITAQRAFEANSKIITTSDELLQDLVNMKH